jgi:UPF0716 protein FxsA
MRIRWWIFGLLIVVSILEIAVLIAVGQVLGLGWTLLLMLATSVIGGWLLKREGRRAWRSVRDNTRAGQAPGQHAIDGVLGLTGGVLMVMPGFISDAFGLLMVAPPTRGLFRRMVEGILNRQLNPQLAGELLGPRIVKIKTGSATSSEPPIEGEIV